VRTKLNAIPIRDLGTGRTLLLELVLLPFSPPIRSLESRSARALRFVDDEKRYLSQLIATRNHLTHSGANNDEMALSVNDLVMATMRLRLLMDLLLLKEIGSG